MSIDTKETIAALLVESLDIPDSAYEAAANRYHDLGNWLSDRSKAKSAQYKPHVFAQGSFRLGTVTKPWKREDYDLDLACELQEGITKAIWTQEALKELVGIDLEAYRVERGIKEGLDERHRCWRLNYEERLKFHMDMVPSIPQAEDTQRILQSRMINKGSSEMLAQSVAKLAVAITDNRHSCYRSISEDWNISNPEGYAKWFESRMQLAQQLLESRALQARVAKVDDLPLYRWKSPLQQAIQVLKRHRDVMFESSPDRKPISIIITTLAATAYRGESDIQLALGQILADMGNLVNRSKPRVSNPVNPDEDFADKWGTQVGRELRLEENFLVWLEQARSDFHIITSSVDKISLLEQVNKKFGIALGEIAVGRIIGSSPTIIMTPKVNHISDAAKPWRCG